MQLQYDEDAIAYGVSLGMTLIRGTELSGEWTFHTPHTIEATSKDGATSSKQLKQAKVHVLGYFTHQTPASALSKLLDELRPRRNQRNTEILAKLKQKFGIDITPQQVIDAGSRELEVQRKTKTKDAKTTPTANQTASSFEYFGRPHIAMALIAAGHAKTISEVFSRFLSDELLELEPWSLDIRTAVRAIADHGGVAVLAHPVTLGLGMVDLESELAHLLSNEGLPLRGIEVYSSKHSSTQSAELLAIALRLGLVPTGGSDYHGVNKESVPLAEFGQGDSAADSTKRWSEINTKSLARLNRMRQAHEKMDPSLVARQSIHLPPNPAHSDGVGYVMPTLVECVIYVAMAGLLLVGVNLFRSHTPPPNEVGVKASLVRFAKTNPLSRCIFGSSHDHHPKPGKSLWSDRA
jgi:hypothetical protein